MDTTRPRVFVIGVSGATWTVLRPLISQGKLPHIARLLVSGCGAELASVKPATDKHFRPQVAWVSMATGCRPERHGVTRFYHEADDLLAPAFWDLAAQQGARVGLYGWPATWPPRPLNGFVVPSHLARDARTWPAELAAIKAIDREQQTVERRGGNALSRLSGAAKSVARFLGYGLRLQTLFKTAITTPAAILGSIEQRRLALRQAKFNFSVDVFLALAERYHTDISSFITFYPDFVSHRYWCYREPEKFPDIDTSDHAFRDAIDRSYMAVDAMLGRLLAVHGENAVLALVSEHGMTAEPLSTEIGPVYFALHGDGLRNLAGLPESVGPHPVARWLAFRPDGADQLDAITKKLRDIIVVETGRPLLQVYQHNGEVIAKFALYRDEPHYVSQGLQNLTLRLDTTIVPFAEIARPFGRRRSAMHDGKGVFVISGPGIHKGGWLEQASVMDIAPTILKAAGLSSDFAFDGQALDIFEPQWPRASI